MLILVCQESNPVHGFKCKSVNKKNQMSNLVATIIQLMSGAMVANIASILFKKISLRTGLYSIPGII